MASLTSHFRSGLPKMPEWAKLSPLVTTVLGMNPGRFTLTGTNCYLVGSGSRRILIDTGEGREEYADVLRRAMDAAECGGIEHIVLTHHHYDHIGGVRQALALSGGACSVWKMPLPEGATAHVSEGGKAADAKPSPLEGLDVLPLVHGQVLRTEGASLRVVHTPGHTKDHVALLLEEDGSLFSGDCVLGIGSGVFEDLSAYMMSLHKLRELSPTALYPGHGPHTTDACALIDKYIAHRQEREQQIVEALKAHASEAPRTVIELVREVYTEIPESLILGAANNLELVLRKLEHDGRVEKSAPLDGTSTSADAGAAGWRWIGSRSGAE
eukprot:CAMPEP_0196782708 /NCGR_PEP_ID=MMETSP1104-20130614/11915_1 /TAXON_ID=33652 /ORGANISM="Cafeteria sp., Strain Caron Lab Isolate" /LENGTH=325 /DNA_ID=CAMNT_0042152951 /DNA_START=9 /DNA_END=986 /DNA_ORIENTATION=+